MPEDNHSDMSRDTVSLTYQELAARLGIDVQSARRRAIRSHWLKIRGNDRKARVMVPRDVLPTDAVTVPATEPPPSPPVTVTPEALSHLLSQVAELAEVRERLGRAEGEVKGLRDALAEARRPFWRRWLG